MCSKWQWVLLPIGSTQWHQ